MFVNYLILNACVKTTEMFICEKILTTSGNIFPNTVTGLIRLGTGLYTGMDMRT
jgi:hypothetical protein